MSEGRTGPSTGGEDGGRRRERKDSDKQKRQAGGTSGPSCQTNQNPKFAESVYVASRVPVRVHTAVCQSRGRRRDDGRR